MKLEILITGLIVISLVSCKTQINSDTYVEFQNKGNEISNLTQGVLLANVAEAMQEGGPVHALEFCNLNASSIVDSLNAVHDCEIFRVSAKNRNSGNNLKTKTDNKLWLIFEKGELNDTVIFTNKKLIYYKPIKTAMPACLKCHGQPNSDIDKATLSKLQKLYPEDLATGYKLNDFRGLWKIEFLSK